jgi:hypothetical protein
MDLAKGKVLEEPVEREQEEAVAVEVAVELSDGKLFCRLLLIHSELSNYIFGPLSASCIIIIIITNNNK